MRFSPKSYLFYLIVGVIFLNLYFLVHLYIQHESENENGKFPAAEQVLPKISNENRQVERRQEKQTQNEFLVLDYTGHQHIFREHDPIECDFSEIDDDFCRSKFAEITNEVLRSRLIERCSRLKTMKVRWTDDQSRLKQADLVSYHSIHMPSHDLPKLERTDERQQYSTVYVLESEVHSSGGHDWHEIDFPMWYNLERSYPEPATYFDLNIYLENLFSPVRVSFEKKTKTAPIVWVISNCNAYNGRQTLVQQLMSHIKVDSYGACLNNVQSSKTQSRTQLNYELYASYKFVIAIENSNCEDYVTEKLIEAISSSSIPIVASRNGKPDYRRFAPKHSFINVYDFPTIKDLSSYLIYLSNNETAYNEYLWFRRPPKVETQNFPSRQRPLKENLRIAEEILGANSTLSRWLLNKETSVNKYCKLTKFIHTTYWKLIYKRKKSDRPTPDEVCLPPNDISNYFSKISNSSK